MPSAEAIRKYIVNDYVEDKLALMYTNDCIFDRFDVKQNSNGQFFATGGYNQSF